MKEGPTKNLETLATLNASLAKNRKERNILSFIIFLGIFMFVIDGSVVSIALPTITRYFQADISGSQWVITSYLVTVTSLLLIFGKLAEWTGKVRLFLLGFVLFTLAS
ncbi:MAG: MFS transporter, partial [Methanothrix sp.]|nr:MFS transporter [Methanothrix sp.]